MDTGTPGSHPHADRPNWKPAETIAEYIANCREGVEAYSDRRAAKLLGWSRAKLWRVHEAGAIPNALFELLIGRERPDGKIPSWKELAAIGRAFNGELAPEEIESCPHCGGHLRTRRQISKVSAEIVMAWLQERRAK